MPDLSSGRSLELQRRRREGSLQRPMPKKQFDQHPLIQHRLQHNRKSRHSGLSREHARHSQRNPKRRPYRRHRPYRHRDGNEDSNVWRNPTRQIRSSPLRCNKFVYGEILWVQPVCQRCHRSSMQSFEQLRL